MTEDRKYRFTWDLLGDVSLGRPNLGQMAHVEAYRLMQFTTRAVIEMRFGAEVAKEVLYEAGKLAGQAFFDQYLAGVDELGEFIKILQTRLRDLGVGIVRIESISKNAERLVLTFDEDLVCSGLPETHFEICVYDEGFISGILENFTGAPYIVKEIDCWCAGTRTCRFTADRQTA